MKNIKFFLSENFQILEVNFSRYLNRRVFVMMTKKGLNFGLVKTFVTHYHTF